MFYDGDMDTLLSPPPPRLVTRNVLLGACIWLIWVLVTGPARTPIVITFAPFVIVPLGLAVAAHRYTGPIARPLHALIRISPVIACSALACFSVDAGPAAAALAVPWFLFTVAVGLVGFVRVLSRRSLLDPGVGTDAALLFLVVGGTWLVISRLGATPMGFDAAIVELTAMHFHYAGFALPILAGAITLRLECGVFVPAAVILGVPITALGIALAGTMEWVAATLMAIAGFLTAAATGRLARRATGTPAALLGIAAASLAGGMCLAIGWAWSRQFGWSYLDLNGMVATHGVLNGFGFCLLGLIALNLLPVPPAPNQVEACLHLGRPSEQRLEQLRERACDDATTNPIGMLHGDLPDGFHHQTWRLPIEHGDMERAAAGIRAWAGHEAAGIHRVPTQPTIVAGQTLAMAIPVGPISVSATARIIEVVDEPDRYGFTYSTLPHHPEDGEESFIIERGPNDELEMVVTAMWRGAAVANHVIPPLTRFLQNKAIGRYLTGTAEFSPADQPATAAPHG